MRLRSTRFARLRRSLLAAAMLLTWTRLLDLGPPVARAADVQPDPARLAERLKRFVQVAGVADQSIVGRMLDPVTIVRAAGLDPAKLCAWVSDNTCWVPYHGVLRGSTGVLLDRLGNSADRAVLLADLVRVAGYETRLARATLPDAVATAQLAKVHRVADDWRPPSFDAPDGGDPAVTDAMRQFGVDPSDLHRRQASAELNSDKLVEAIVGRSTEQTPAVAALAWPGGKPAVTASVGTDERAALADHWWVEYRHQPSDAWASLDPTCGGAPPIAATETIVRGTDGRFALSPSVTHEVEIRIIREQWHDGALHQDVVLRHALRTKDVIGQPVLVLHQPIGWPSPLDLTREPDPAAKFRQVLAAPREWVPTLVIGTQVVTQGGVNADGSIDPKPALDALALTGDTVGKGATAAADLLGTMGDPAAPAGPVGVLTAEWIEYEIRTPGQGRPQVVRRDLFDSVGPAARATGVTAQPTLTEAQRVEQALARLGRSDLALQPCAIPAAFVQHLALRSLLDNADTLTTAVSAPPATYAGVDAAVGKLVPSSVPLYGLASARFVACPVAGSVYLDHTNVLVRHQRLRQAPPGATAGDGPFPQVVAFDVVENGVAVHPRPGVDPVTVRMTQGVADTVAESVLLDPGGTRTDNASDLFAAATSRGQAWVAMAPTDAAKLASMDLPADAKARVSADLQAGHTVLVAAGPRGPGGLAWWSVDPATGQTLGISSNGWGGVMAEYAFQIQFALKCATLGFCCIGSAMGGGDKAVGGILFCAAAAAIGVTGIVVGGEAAGVIGGVSEMLSVGAGAYNVLKK